MPAKSIREARSTSGEEIRNEKVIPKGNPALVKPMNSGIDEQAQNGVIVPNKAPNIFADIPLYRPKIFLVRSGGKKLCTYEIMNIKTDNNIKILTTS